MEASASTEEKHVPTKGMYGWITHTDLASNNPAATKAWAAKVLGWTFRPPFKGPAGEIHLFAYSDQGGGGIRPLSPPEIPGSIPYIHVADCQASYDKASEGRRRGDDVTDQGDGGRNGRDRSCAGRSAHRFLWSVTSEARGHARRRPRTTPGSPSKGSGPT